MASKLQYIRQISLQTFAAIIGANQSETLIHHLIGSRQQLMQPVACKVASRTEAFMLFF